MSAAAISGDYTDLKFIRTRKVCQIVVEIPIEQAGAFVEAFGTPRPDGNVPVALAKLDPKATQSPPKAEDKPRERKRSRAQEAGIACSDARFLVFLREVWAALDVYSEQSARTAVLRLCRGIQSRRELDTNEAAQREWDALYSQFKAWLAVAA